MRLGPVNFPDELIKSIRDNRLVVFAGAGVSMGTPANLPSFRALVDQIASGTGLSSSDPLDRFLGNLEDRGVAVHSLAAKILSPPDLQHNQLHEDLQQLFIAPEQVRLVTTNFESLFEQAAQKLWGRVPEVFLAPALPLGRKFKGIVHAHGVVTAPDSMVLTDSDFGRAYLTEGWAR